MPQTICGELRMDDPEGETKEFSGGWRNKVTGVVYYNTCTQTIRYGEDKRERWSQTDFSADKFTNVEHDVAVQTSFFPDVRDRIVESTSKHSTVKEATDEKLLGSVIKIQRFYRAHRGGQTARQPASVSLRSKNTKWRQMDGEPSFYRSRDFVILNRTSPRTRTDFELLYNLLDRWRVCETVKAGEQMFDSSRIALCSLILSKEVELLRAIDATRTSAKSEGREKSYRKFLDELSRPVVWRDRRGEPIYVETSGVQRAKGFKATYETLSKEDGPTDERLSALIELRRSMESHTCNESDELIRLLDQEVDLLNRNVDERKLKWLRSRLKIAYLRLAREALKCEREDSKPIGGRRPDRKTICRSCGRLMPAGKFSQENRRRSSSCDYCLYAKARTGPRVVYEPYLKLLRDVRRREARLRCYTSLAFVVDAKVVYHLVNGVWHGKSAISENDCIEELRLVRFRNEEEWSPWNCLLLTEGEASLHRKVEHPEKFYGAMILQKFHTKNLQAKVQFGSVAEFKSGRERKESLLFPGSG